MRAFVGLGLCIALAGCGVASTLEGWSKQQKAIPTETSVLVSPAPQLEEGEAYRARIKEFTLMALFSKVVYRQDIPEEKRPGSGCSYLNGGVLEFGMPTHSDGSGWRRLVVKQTEGARETVSCYDAQGLYYETYAHYGAPSAAQPDIAVIAIRGTENYTFSEQWRDWASNFAAAMNFDPTEYRLARENVGPLLAYMRKTFPELREIYVTGHSLGGGIAQQLAYTSTDIKAAYVFDSSPVSNWSQMENMNPSPIQNPYPTIFRVNHTKEFLKTARVAATRVTSVRLNRSDYEFLFQEDDRIGAHEMGILACHFAVRLRKENGRFDFPAAYIPKMIADQAICPTEKKKVVLPAELLAAYQH